jgi:probable lipoprotein NlpC
MINKRSYFFLLVLIFFLASCGTRRNTVKTDSKASKAADAMAALHSKDLYRFITDWIGVKYKLGGLDK